MAMGIYVECPNDEVNILKELHISSLLTIFCNCPILFDSILLYSISLHSIKFHSTDIYPAVLCIMPIHSFMHPTHVSQPHHTSNSIKPKIIKSSAPLHFTDPSCKSKNSSKYNNEFAYNPFLPK